MPRREDDAIVLDAKVQQESDRSVVMLTAQGERVFAYAPHAAASLRRFGPCLQPGSRIHVLWTVRREGALPVLDEATLLAPPPKPDPLERYYATAHVLELANAFAREGQEDPRLYRLVARVLERLAAGDPWEPLARYSEAWALRLAGLFPDLDVCAVSGAPLVRRTAFVAPEMGAVAREHAPAGAYALGPEAQLFLDATRTCAPDALPPMGAAGARELARALPGLVQAFTERPLVAWAALARLGESPPRDRSGETNGS